MACTVCEHCLVPLNRHEKLTVIEGFSYHKKCSKCYVCSETNLHDAELFKGVIFCSSCSQRIFQGCSTARNTKGSARKTREKCRSHRTQDRPEQRAPNILEMAGLIAIDTDSSKASGGTDQSKQSKSLAISTELDLTVGEPLTDELPKCMKRGRVETAVSTDATQELMQQMGFAINKDQRNLVQLTRSPPKSPPKKTDPCSDLRIAELGVSTEIANMALRHKSELPVIIKSTSLLKRRLLPSQSGSLLNTDSVVTGGRNDEWLDSAYSTLKNSVRSKVKNKRFHIVKTPYKAFKKNILKRSSLISIRMSLEDKATLLSRLKVLFNEEVTLHQKRGLKRLYSTINRKTKQSKLGWLNLVANVYSDTNNNMIRCKHFNVSHSYRCMRAQVMRLAGPTKSELAVFRSKVKNMVAPGFLRHMATVNHYPAITMSQSCGNLKPGSTKVY